jgi:hypothetical protein
LGGKNQRRSVCCLWRFAVAGSEPSALKPGLWKRCLQRA